MNLDFALAILLIAFIIKVMSQVFLLYRLQQIDLQLDQATSRLIELNQLLENDADLRQAQDNFSHQKNIVQELEKKLRLIERDVEQQNIKIEQSEAALYGGRIKNPKELKDLEDEVKALKKYLQVLEDRQLESMIHLEEESQTLQDLENVLQRVKQEVFQRNSRYLGEKADLEKEIQRLENERATAITGIETTYYERYQTIRSNKKGIAVSRVQDKCCSACGTTLTGGLIQESRSPDRLAFCPSCGRILYGG
ncbi:MAG: hypothetical protein D6735_04930 [Acidobacteria bacterium]|jgi:predicted  nucleic acid-binding Zn-ribbon protein|nr:MAG: hypothetical protein DDG59_06620 [Anaerolineae bacterium]RMG05804.1 MAG: hypothetical protein D6735_04930 [Acidobacteriota bacterium]